MKLCQKKNKINTKSRAQKVMMVVMVKVLFPAEGEKAYNMLYAFK